MPRSALIALAQMILHPDLYFIPEDDEEEEQEEQEQPARSGKGRVKAQHAGEAKGKVRRKRTGKREQDEQHDREGEEEKEPPKPSHEVEEELEVQEAQRFIRAILSRKRIPLSALQHHLEGIPHGRPIPIDRRVEVTNIA